MIVMSLIILTAIIKIITIEMKLNDDDDNKNNNNNDNSKKE